MNKVPVATYRLQLHKDFSLTAAQAVVPYLGDLRISHLYLSPLMESVAGSTHGYDTIDFARVSGERGGEEKLADLDRTLQSQDMKMIVDIVPNHMGVVRNPYWIDVLSKGPASEYWGLFDIRTADGAKLRLPLLKASLEKSLAEGALAFTHDKDFGYGVQSEDHFFPFNQATQKSIAADPDMTAQRLKSLLDNQFYTLVSRDDINAIDYRRFFHILDLVGVRQEDHAVFDMTHQKIKDIAARYPSFDGVRIDHIDGLGDPVGYLDRLHHDVKTVWIEKILTGNEPLPARWSTLGTTGYEFTYAINQLMTHPGNFRRLQDYFTGRIEPRWKDFHECVLQSKEETLHRLFSSELERLVNFSSPDGENAEKARLFWTGISVCLPVYRTYGTKSTLSDQDMQALSQASREARRRFGEEYAQSEVLFLPTLLEPQTDQQRQARAEWQQLTGPVMAKGLEDNAHYRFFPLAALNEVGCEPVAPLPDAEIFASLNRRTIQNPLALNATTTHDTKRSEDTRQRLYTLADDPDRWIDFFEKATVVNKTSSVDIQTEYFFYQTILATWPLDGKVTPDYVTRIQDYMQKAGRESGEHTNWAHPDEVYETRLSDYVAASLASPALIRHLGSYMPYVMTAGAINSLAVQTLKILAPGIPDIYQGTESWGFSLVDPDNRRPVDYDALRRGMEKIRAWENDGRPHLIGKLTDEWKDGSIKQWLTRELLGIRREYITPLKQPLTLQRLETRGERQENILAYSLRAGEKDHLVVAVPRYPGMLLGDTFNALSIPPEQWRDTAVALPDGRWRNLLEEMSPAEGAFAPRNTRFPVSVFVPAP